MEREMVVEYIPALPGKVLSKAVFYYFLTFVPKGRLARREDVEKYVAKVLGVSWVHCVDSMYPPYNDLIRILDIVPRHREVSTIGEVGHGVFDEETHQRLLKEESHEIIPSTSTKVKRMPRVKDYKKHLFDFFKEVNVDATTIMDIHKKQNFLEYIE